MNAAHRTLLALLPLALCSACGKEVVAKRIPVPAQWLVCKDQPVPPAEDTDKAVAGFIVDLIDAGADCRNAVKAIADWDARLGKSDKLP